ncbi:MAG: hypothetical protein AB4426_19690 [Xenococcaceae cyanobacterium]
MKAYELTAKVTPEGQLEFTDTLLNKLPINQEVKVIVLVNEPTDTEAEANADWSRLAAEQFFYDYSEADAIYDEI